MQFPISIGLHRSRFLDLLVLLSALSASGAILLWPQAITTQLLVLVATWFLAAMAWRGLTPRFSALRLERSGQISVAIDASAPFAPARLLPGSSVHPWLTIIRLEIDAKQQSTLIAAVDGLKEDDFRRLRVFLRWQADFNASADDA
ncbi:protein YgfX [Dechloromonas denitrificans]|uniref:protein YgfX n=1 Tax=Dechloromonas denitrificans TaxID=281362 RepID=UPI0012FBE0C1|nr:protein YgfX [Dechloromonas denitrificans]